MDRFRAFRNRQDAGRRLAGVLAMLAVEHPIVLGIPRGGVIVSAEVAETLEAEHGVVVARKLGAPGNAELAIGATTASGVTYIDNDIAGMVGMSNTWLDQEVERQSARARQYEEQFNGHARPQLAGRDVFVVDDGVATGSTAIAAIRSVRSSGARKVIFAVPVGPPHTLERLKQEADEVVCLIDEPMFFAVGQFYADFGQVEDEEVRAVIDRLAARKPRAARA
jgi:predicted phosphoribosyltransferase